VSDIYPQRLPDLFDGKPLVVTGRYTTPIKGSIRLRGKRAGEDFVRDIPVTLTTSSDKNDVLAGFWARRRIDDLMSQDWAGAQGGSMKPDMQKEITQLGLDYRLMTQFTSFVAVEDRVVTKDGKPQRVEVPVEMPEGVSYEQVLGDEVRGGYWAAGGVNQSVTVSASVASTRTRNGPASVVGGALGKMGNVFSAHKAAPPPSPPPADVPSSPTKAGQPKLTPERKALESKLHPSLLEAFDCAAKQEHDCKLVHDGKVEVQIWLTENSAGMLEQLRQSGFEPAVPQAGKSLAGTLPVEKLQALAQMKEVKFVSLVRK
jgi:Ca-activated chloride channel homolog